MLGSIVHRPVVSEQQELHKLQQAKRDLKQEIGNSIMFALDTAAKIQQVECEKVRRRDG